MTASPTTDLLLPGTPGYRRLNGAMVLAGLAAFGLLYAAQPVLPQLSEEFGVGPSAASLTVSASTGALALAVLPAAALAGRWGRVRVMRVGLVASVVLTLAMALAPDFTTLAVLRALSGLTLAAVVGVAMSHVGAEVHPGGLGSAMGLYVAGNSLGGVGGRLLTAGVSDGTSWRWGVAATFGTRGSALYVGAYYAGSSVFGLEVGESWAAYGWGGVVASVAALAAVGLGAGLAVSALSRAPATP